ncbi:MAG: alpha/beta hydrolase family protein [Leadbetterella sp.]
MLKKITLLFLLSTLYSSSFSQEIVGKWYGILKVQTLQLRLVFNITKSGEVYNTTMDSPDQGANGIPIDSTQFRNANLKIILSSAKIEYNGKLQNDSLILGTFKQNGFSFPLTLSRKSVEKLQLKRPQEPKEPFPYYSEDVIFKNTKANIELAGTLTLPKKEGNYPAMILISGSGPQNRNEELLGHKPFLVLSDYLTKQGIAVLRFDDRGTGLSKGNFKTSTSQDFASDVEAGIQYLKSRKEINHQKIGLIGHSEGGIIAPMVASHSSDVALIVLLSGTGIPGDELLLLQQRKIGLVSGKSERELNQSEVINKKAFEIVTKSNDQAKLSVNLSTYFKEVLKEYKDFKPEGFNEEEFIKIQVDQLTNPWMQYFIQYDPKIQLEKVKCPVLALNGSKDLQVSSKENLAGIKRSLDKGGNKDVTILELSNLNHLFQECKTGSPTEYSEIEQTFSPIALDEIGRWITKKMK